MQAFNLQGPVYSQVDIFPDFPQVYINVIAFPDPKPNIPSPER